MPQYLPLIGTRVVDSHSQQIGFVDPTTPRESLVVEAPKKGLLHVQLTRTAPAPPYDRHTLDQRVRRNISWRTVDDDRLHQALEKYFPITHYQRPTIAHLASFLSIRLPVRQRLGKDAPVRKLALFSRQHLRYDRNELRAPDISCDQIPGWTDNLHLVNLTTYVGQARPWISHAVEHGHYNLHVVRFEFASGTEVIPVRAEISGAPEPYENVQLWEKYRRPKHVYSSDRGIVWWRTGWGVKSARKYIQPFKEPSSSKT